MRSWRQLQAEVWIAAAFDEVADVGKHLAFFGNASEERGAIDDLAEGLALGQRAEREL